MVPVALSIAGSDPSGGAGLFSDLKTFHQHGVYGAGVVSLLTVQNSVSVKDVKVLDPSFVLDQLDAVLEDIPPGAAKTGALGNAAVIEALAGRAAGFDFPLVVDPVMISKHGDSLLDEEGIRAMTASLIPHAFLVTPNRHEAAILAGMEVSDADAMEDAARAIHRLGARNVLIKGGEWDGCSLDVLWTGEEAFRLTSDRIDTVHLHGTGCALSAAIVAILAQGGELHDAVRAAKQYVTTAIRTNPGLGQGHGPINLHARIAHDKRMT